MRPIFPLPFLSRRGAAALAVGALAAAALLHATLSRGELASDKQPLAWQTPLDFSSYDLSGGSAVAYRGDYIRATWDGDLVAYDVDKSGAFSVKWRAREKLAAAGSRVIFTSTASGTGAAFRWSGTSSISDAQKSLLGDATTGPQVLDYLRGDTSNEISETKSTGFRPRFSRLGAILHSRPYHHAGVVYVGANDGMLHAFDASTGAENFAYVPSMLFAGSKLASLATTLDTDFPYLVDGSLAIGMDGSVKVLVGGLGAGAKGLYALNITNPQPASESVAKGMAKWEITDATSGYDNLGHVMTAPQIVKLNSGVTAVLVPNGLDSKGKVSSLFVIDATNGALLKEISAGTAFDDGRANALGGIAAVDEDGNGTVDVVYAGDLKGTLWKFDLGSSSYPSAASALFVPASTSARPITAAPSVSRHPRGGLMVNFGTGQATTKSDLSTTTTEYLYGVWDQGSVEPDDLVTQTFTARTHSGSSTLVRTVTGNAVDYGSATPKKGWRIALTGGERVIGGSLLTDSGRFMVTTAVLNTGAAQGAWLLQVSALTGGPTSTPFLDLDGDGEINDADSIEVTSGGKTTTLVPVGKALASGVWSQPVLGRVSASRDIPFLNHNTNQLLTPYTVETVVVPPTGGGVSHGHFDFDIYRSCGTSAASNTNCTNTHVHEYDDKYDVVGVHLLSPSLDDFKLSKAVTANQQFKVLLANTRWSPAAAIKLGSNIANLGWRLPTSGGFLATGAGGSAAVFTTAALTDFVFVLPPDAFEHKDWGTGEDRAGLIPTQTGCVRSNNVNNGVWMDGAFTIQVVSASATADDVQPSGPAGSGGYRLKDTATARAKLLAQYTAFWHKKDWPCKTQNGWTATPGQDPDTTGGTRPAGSLDPQGNYFELNIGKDGNGSTGGTGGSTSTRLMYNGIEVVVSLSFSNEGVTQVLKKKSDQSVVNTSSSNFGAPKSAGQQLGLQPRLGRLGWKEIVP